MDNKTPGCQDTRIPWIPVYVQQDTRIPGYRDTKDTMYTRIGFQDTMDKKMYVCQDTRIPGKTGDPSNGSHGVFENRELGIKIRWELFNQNKICS